ncbi:MAG TPA: OB-fold nucleic acid binding domain-containing protein, partial [Anaerolineae bacterium]|nr:OB-fold nucleic acid binding domain-containing protein [Anaerolineae bacterium]
MTEERSERDAARLAKLDELRSAGIEPYPARLQQPRTHTATEAIAAFVASEADGENALPVSVCVAGRMMSRRLMGKVGFAHIDDGSAHLQVFVRRDTVGEETFELFKRLLDLGDFIAVCGEMMRTRTGEISVNAQSMQLLSKSLEPMPDKWHGVKDVETRYRRRYVDLMINPEVREVFVARARMVQAIREYLDGAGFIAVETPVLQPIYGGAAARPFTTYHNQLKQDLFLRISFELYLKRLLVGGLEKVYEIGRDFRNEGISFKHNPEFT